MRVLLPERKRASDSVNSKIYWLFVALFSLVIFSAFPAVKITQVCLYSRHAAAHPYIRRAGIAWLYHSGLLAGRAVVWTVCSYDMAASLLWFESTEVLGWVQ